MSWAPERIAEGMAAVAKSIDWSLPLVCLDIDGVVAPYEDSKSPHWDDWVENTRAGFVMAFSAQMTQRLADLPASRVWLTTWEEQANKYLLDGLGWEPLPTLRSEFRNAPALYLPGGEEAGPYSGAVPELSPTSGRRWWKLNSLHRLLRYVEADPDELGLHLPPALVWADDDLKSNPAARSWAKKLGFPALTISPDRRWGLSRDEVDQISEFVHRHLEG